MFAMMRNLEKEGKRPIPEVAGSNPAPGTRMQLRTAGKCYEERKMLVSSRYEMPCARGSMCILRAERTKGKRRATIPLDNSKILGLFVVESVPR